LEQKTNSETHNKKRTFRNLIIFVVAINVLGWLSFIFARSARTSDVQGLGMIVWLVSPLLVSILLRLLAKDGWEDIGIKPNFKGNGNGGPGTCPTTWGCSTALRWQDTPAKACSLYYRW
jgi:hypothetical protein